MLDPLTIDAIVIGLYTAITLGLCAMVWLLARDLRRLSAIVRAWGRLAAGDK